MSEPRLKIMTDGVHADNTRVFIDGREFNSIQKIRLCMLATEIDVCEMTFYPFGKNIMDQNPMSLSEELMDWKNVLTIFSNGNGANSYVELNGQLLNNMREVLFSQEVNHPPKIRFQKLIKSSSPVIEDRSQVMLLHELPGYVK